MTDRKVKREKIVRLFQEATKGRGSGTSYKVVIATAVIIAILSTSVTLIAASHFYGSRNESIILQSNKRMEEKERLFTEKLNGLHHALARKDETRILAERLPIENLSVRHLEGNLAITGQIRNTSNRSVGDIELTIFCLDEKGHTVCTETFTASSSDGRPLMKGQRRKFKHRVNNIQPTAKDVLILITALSQE